jgi:hypothetical protein
LRAVRDAVIVQMRITGNDTALEVGENNALSCC